MKKKNLAICTESWATPCKTMREIWQSPLSKTWRRALHLCLVVDKSSEVPHPRAEKGGGEEEVGSAKTFGCQSMPPQKTCFWFELAVVSKFCKSLLTYKIYFTQKSEKCNFPTQSFKHDGLEPIPIMFLFFFVRRKTSENSPLMRWWVDRWKWSRRTSWKRFVNIHTFN